MARSWRTWNRAIHRDLGYLAVGLTLVYALSGLLVNHAETLQPDYRTLAEPVSFSPVPASSPDAAEAAVVAAVGRGQPSSGWWVAEGELELFYAGGVTVRARPADGEAVVHAKEPRTLVKLVDDLHRNRMGSAWTVVADVYAVSLGALAITGAILLKGRKGLRGRGKWLLLAGFLIPLAFMVAALL